MTRRPSVIRAALAATGLLAAGLVGALPAHADGTAPPWAPSGVSEDQNAVSGLTFYDASGNVITSGSTQTAPFAAYVMGRQQTRAVSWTDTKAALFGYVPQVGVTPDQWTGNQLGLASTFPDSAAPGALATSALPLYSGSATDTTLDAYTANNPNTATQAGYQDVYEIRLYTNAPHHTLSVEYDYADIAVDSTTHTWSVVWSPGVATAPEAPSTISATAGNAAATVSWTAPASDGGSPITGYTLQYSSDGGTSWTSTPHSGTGTSQLVSGLANGTSYVFHVSATNAIGTGGYSPTSTAVVPVAPPVADVSSLSIASTTVIRYGASATVIGTLADTRTHAGVPGVVLSLCRRAAANKPWILTKNVATAANGSVKVSIGLVQNWQWQWRYAGNAQHRAVNSGLASTSVSQIVSAAGTRASIKHGATETVFGTVTPAGTGQVVYLQQLVGKTWQTTAVHVAIKSQKLPNGKRAIGFVLTIKLARAGTYHLRVYKPATSTLAGGLSGTVTVAAK